MDRRQLYSILLFCGLFLIAISSHAQQQENQEQQIGLLIQQLGVPDTQEAAIEGLVELGASAVPALTEKALRGPEPALHQVQPTDDPLTVIQKGAWKALVRIGEPAVPHLIEAAGDDDLSFGGNAISVLEDIGEPAQPYLVSAMEHENALVRRRTVELLMTLHKPPIPVLLKALRSEDSQVQDKVLQIFMGTHDYREGVLEVADAMLELLDYENPHRNFYAIYPYLKYRDRLRLSLALNSPKWSVRFGVAVAYLHAWNRAYRPTSIYRTGPLPPEVIPNLIEGFNRGIKRGDIKLCEMAVLAFKWLDLAEYQARRTLDDIHKAKTALEAFPPPVILESAVKDGDNLIDITPLNQEGISFKFNNFIDHASANITRLDVKPRHRPLIIGGPFGRLKGEPLDWDAQKESPYHVKLVPTPKDKLVAGADYLIELRIIDLYGKELNSQIRFTTKAAE